MAQTFQNWPFYHNGIHYNIVDSPGFDDPTRDDVGIILELAQYLELTFRAQFMVSGVVYIQTILARRFTRSFAKNLLYLRKLCGTQSFRKVSFVTSFWDVIICLEAGEKRE